MNWWISKINYQEPLRRNHQVSRSPSFNIFISLITISNSVLVWRENLISYLIVESFGLWARDCSESEKKLRMLRENLFMVNLGFSRLKWDFEIFFFEKIPWGLRVNGDGVASMWCRMWCDFHEQKAFSDLNNTYGLNSDVCVKIWANGPNSSMFWSTLHLVKPFIAHYSWFVLNYCLTPFYFFLLILILNFWLTPCIIA